MNKPQGKMDARNSKKVTTVIALILSAAMFGAPRAAGGEVRIIANPSVKAENISAGEIKSVYLEERDSLRDGTHVEPVLSKTGKVHADFLANYLGLSENDLRTYYRALVFTGRGSMPKEMGTDAAVVAYVARTRGAIGYVSAESSAEGVKTLIVADSAAGNQRQLIQRIEPEYPATLKQLKIGGTVRLRVTISAHGNVEAAELVGGNPILGEAAQAAIRKWMYSPGKARTITEVRIDFDGQ